MNCGGNAVGTGDGGDEREDSGGFHNDNDISTIREKKTSRHYRTNEDYTDR